MCVSAMCCVVSLVLCVVLFSFPAIALSLLLDLCLALSQSRLLPLSLALSRYHSVFFIPLAFFLLHSKLMETMIGRKE